MRAPFSFIKASGGGASPFDPTTLALTGYWRASYAGAPWAATASAGISATTDALVAGIAPSTGTAQNSFTPASLDGATKYLNNPTQLSTLFTAGAGGIVVLYNAAGAIAPHGVGSEYLDPYAFGDGGNGGLGLNFTTSGFTAFFYDGSYKVATKAQALDAWALAMMRWDSTNLGLTVNSAIEVTTPCGVFATSMAQAVTMGTCYGGASFLQGDMLEVMCIDRAFTDPDFANIKSYVNARYGLSL